MPISMTPVPPVARPGRMGFIPIPIVFIPIACPIAFPIGFVPIAIMVAPEPPIPVAVMIPLAMSPRIGTPDNDPRILPTVEPKLGEVIDIPPPGPVAVGVSLPKISSRLIDVVGAGAGFVVVATDVMEL